MSRRRAVACLGALGQAMTRILVIDDDREVCVLLTRILAREGFDVVEADSGKVALARMREEPFDVVVTDIVMPDKIGRAHV